MREEGEGSGGGTEGWRGRAGWIGGGCREEGEGSREVQKDGEGELGGLEEGVRRREKGSGRYRRMERESWVDWSRVYGGGRRERGGTEGWRGRRRERSRGLLPEISFVSSFTLIFSG